MTKKMPSNTSTASLSKQLKSTPPKKGVKGSAAADPVNSVAMLQAEKLAQTNAMVAAMPFNVTKTSEHGFKNGTAPLPGGTVALESWVVTASTQSEVVVSDKVGTQAQQGLNPANGSLDRVRVDSSGQHLTTN